MPLFSIVVIHYQGSIPHPAFLRGINSLLNQKFRDFEILCYHDGPLLDSSVSFPVPVKATATRFDDWGHSLRDIGIREAKGDYIVHFNADNALLPNALEAIAAEIHRPPRLIDPDTQVIIDTNDMILFPILLMGVQAVSGNLYRSPVPTSAFWLILTAHPPVFGNIDCMQLVIKREIWLKEGGWYDKSRNSDSIMYEAFCKKYGYRTCNSVLGHHY